jgi:LPS sulfotransferase NodH
MTTQLYGAQFDEALDVQGTGPVERTLIVASTPRSGSHMLGHAMIGTNRMGRPFEYGNPINMSEWMRRTKTDDVPTMFESLMRRRTTANNVFALKLHHSHLAAFGSLAEALRAFPNPCVVRIQRSDILAQAISLSVARQTGIWISGQDGTGREPRYDVPGITAALQELAIMNARWTADLKTAGVNPLMIDFDTVRYDTPAVLQCIADFASIDMEKVALPETPPTKRQSGSPTAGWAERYARDITHARPRILRRLRRKIRSILG